MNGMQHLAMGVFLTASTALALSLAWGQPAPVPAAQTVTVRLSNFDFAPAKFRLRVGVPVHLQLINDSTGGHDFSAPAFFAASTLVSGLPPRDGTVEVPPKGSVDLTVVPRALGTYKVECTHFMHSLFGMSGTISVEAAPG